MSAGIIYFGETGEGGGGGGLVHPEPDAPLPPEEPKVSGKWRFGPPSALISTRSAARS